MNILVTGGAGFIGSNIVEALLDDDRVDLVRVLDNLSTGYLDNIQRYMNYRNFEFMKGDIRDFETCMNACKNINRITHQAALGSVPRSVKDPVNTNAHNITGTLNIFTAAKDSGVNRVVYASSSSVYGDHLTLPKVEHEIGNPLSPYAVTKLVSEQYARVFGELYDIYLIGLRYFNVFGPRQSPEGAYAAVIPLFIQALANGDAPLIHGDGFQSRDFTYVDNAVQANVRALFSENKESLNQVYNVAMGEQTSLNELYAILKTFFEHPKDTIHGPERVGDIKHSLANIEKIKSLLGYEPTISIREGLQKTTEWFLENYK